MISGNKGFRKQGTSKGHKPVHNAVTFRNDRNKRPKKKGSPLAGVKIIPATKIETLLHGEDPVVKATREREEALNEERALIREQYAAEQYAKREAALLEEQRIKYQKETEMADMKTELTKVINSWDDEPTTDNTIPEVPQVEIKPGTSVSQAVFDYVRDNPNVTRLQVAQALSSCGYRETTVVALVSQFVRQKLFAMGEGKRLTVTRKTYMPMYHKHPREAMHNAPVAVPTPVSPAVQPPAEWVTVAVSWSTESIIDKLNIRQARAVYDELHTLLGMK